ncbi:hypothetical protein HC891_20835 [Candidatus Gracilibacteria bacterium]|nr:hypothetical protein [Candidatus Gracilibacteria bacterium]
MLRTAIAEVKDDTRLISAELSLKGAAVTEVDYQLNDKSGQLAIVGFDNEIIGDWSLLNPERIGLAAAAAVVVLVILGAVLFTMLSGNERLLLFCAWPELYSCTRDGRGTAARMAAAATA